MGRLLNTLTRLDFYRKPAAFRYGLAIAFALAALAGNFLPQAGQKLPFIFFFGAVGLSARMCGFGPAVLTTLVSGLLAEFFFLVPVHSFSVNSTSMLQVVFFILISLIITSVALQKSAADTAAQLSQSRLAETLKSISEGFIVYNREWTITYINEAGAELRGSTVAAMTGQNVWKMFPDLVGSKMHDNLMKAVQGGTPVHFDYYYPRLDRFFRTAAYPSPHGLTCIFQDISEASRTAEALNITERRLQFAQVAGHFGSWEWNLKTDALWWSDGIFTLHGHEIGSVKPGYESWQSFIHPDDRERCQQAVQRALAGRSDYSVEYRTTYPNGQVHWIATRGQVIRDEANQPQRMVGIALDITDRKLAEEALRKSEKLAAAGRLAATIAHEINNPLEAVTNLMFLLREGAPLDQKSLEYVKQAEHELARVAHVTRQTLGFYRDTASPRSIDLSQAVRDVVSLYQHRIQGKKIKLSGDYGDSVQVTGLSGELRQVISNLVTNAIDALPENGSLAIRVHAARALNDSHGPGGRIVIADSGSGISEEHRKRLFEPFYTTKQDVGTGLGLWVSQEIVKKHGGSITFRSSVRPGHSGTVFSVFIPHHGMASAA
jgi:PAS domain S-box-containing protein